MLRIPFHLLFSRPGNHRHHQPSSCIHVPLHYSPLSASSLIHRIRTCGYALGFLLGPTLGGFLVPTPSPFDKVPFATRSFIVPSPIDGVIYLISLPATLSGCGWNQCPHGHCLSVILA